MTTASVTWTDSDVAPRPLVERLHEWVTTVDHKRLGVLYIVYALVFLVIGGIEAMIMRIQLIAAHTDFVSPQVFNRMFTMHGTTMIFFVAMPLVFGFANYLVPLMIGARDMAFPRLNAFSFWLTAFGGLLLYFSCLGGSGLSGAGNAPDVGWFAYAPLTAKTFSPGHSTDYWTLALLVSGFGSIGTAINILTTILCMRCPGMTLGRMPLLAWLSLTMAVLVILAVSPLSAAQIMLLVDRYLGGHFFDTQAGGSAVMWMHFFWVFGHPEVYVLVIPAFAFASGIMLGSAPFDWHLGNSYFVVAHFHYVIVGAILFTVFAAFYYWFPKFSGRLYSETLGRLHFWLFFIGFHLTFDCMHIPGLLGMPRRIYTYEPGRGWDTWNLLVTIGVVFQGLGTLVFVANLVWSYFRGARAGNDPWDAWTLEWSTESPPPAYNFATLPVVRSSRPLWDIKHPEDPDW